MFVDKSFIDSMIESSFAPTADTGLWLAKTAENVLF